MLSAFAFADRSHDRTQFGHNISISPDEQVTDATCFGCSVHIRGHVSGDVTTFGGSVVVEDGGAIDGDVTTFAGNTRLEHSVAVKGDVTVFGGRVYRDPTATIEGDVSNFGAGPWIVLVFAAPFLVLGLFVAAVIWLIRRLMRPSPAAV